MRLITQLLLVTCMLFLCTTTLVFAQENTITISGTVLSADTGEPMAGVNVVIKGKMSGTVTNAQGGFSLQTTVAPPFTLVFSMVGFRAQEMEITGSRTDISIRLQEQSILGQEVVISASRIEESILKSPVSIEKMEPLAIRETPAANFYEGIQNLKSVDMVTTSLGFKVVNTRGFHSTGNSRFVQIIDGMDNQAPGLNFPAGNLVGISDIDAESVELIPGAASALYGPNAFNGVLLMNSKNPFQYQGLSVMAKTGINHVDDPAHGVAPLYDMQLRYAKAFKNKFAFKVNAAYMKALDWYATDYTDIDQGTPADRRGINNPVRDALNIYGDEQVQDFSTRNIPGLTRVSRTGYEEKDLVDYNVKNLKLDGALHYRLNERMEMIYHYKYGSGTTVYQGANRYSLSGFILQQHKLELRGANYFVRAYTTQENSGGSYDSRFLAQNLNRTWKSDADWFRDYATGYSAALTTGNTQEQAHTAARAFADRGRLIPGTPEFEREKKRIAGTTDFTKGAKFNDRTGLYHVEGQYDLSGKVAFADILIGGNYRLYDLNSNGTIFADTAGNNITIYEYGAFVQASKKLMMDKLKITVSGRYDKNENFKGRFNPRASVVYTIGENHNLRASFQTGFRIPTTQDQFINLNIGTVRLVGGVPSTSRGLNAYENSFTRSSVTMFGAAVQRDIAAGKAPSQAVIDNKKLLEKSNVAYIRPEQVQAFEIGYKGLIGTKLMIDASYYYSSYKDFILNNVVVRTANPVLNNEGSVNTAAAFDLVNNSAANPTIQPFVLYTNARDRVAAQGATLGITYSLGKGYNATANGTWADFNLKNANPNEIAPFNTPRFKTNLMFGNRNAWKNVGFNVAWRWQEGFEWTSSFTSFIPGYVPSYNTLDVQVSYKIQAIKSIIKLGGSNVTNNRFVQAYGAPTIGGIYYISLTFDEMLR